MEDDAKFGTTPKSGPDPLHPSHLSFSSNRHPAPRYEGRHVQEDGIRAEESHTGPGPSPCVADQRR